MNRLIQCAFIVAALSSAWFSMQHYYVGDLISAKLDLLLGGQALLFAWNVK